jgi:DNA-binding transcriptional ArsR family regulator
VIPTQYRIDPGEYRTDQLMLIFRTLHMKDAQLTSPFRLPASPAPSDLVAKYFRGFGDPLRVRILELLRAEGELSVGELVRRLGEPQPKVSNHLACLRWCGFVETRREHRTVVNRIADPRVFEMLDLAHALLADNAEHVAACCRIDA